MRFYSSCINLVHFNQKIYMSLKITINFPLNLCLSVYFQALRWSRVFKETVLSVFAVSSVKEEFFVKFVFALQCCALVSAVVNFCGYVLPNILLSTHR